MTLNEIKIIIKRVLKEISEKEKDITNKITELQKLERQTRIYMEFLDSFNVLDQKEDKELNSKINEVQDEIQSLFTMLQDIIEVEKEKEKKQKEEEAKNKQKQYAGRSKITAPEYQKDQQAVKTMPRKKVK